MLVTTYRDPVHWAKVTATIDWRSEGRFILGVGIGWMEEEFVALGRADVFSQRAQVADEQLRVARNLFTEERCSFDGDFYSYDEIAFYPKAYDSPVPVWCGGESRSAQKRAGTHGDAAGRDPDAVKLNCCLSVEVTDEPVALQFLVGRYPQRLAQMERLAPVIAG